MIHALTFTMNMAP